MQNIKINIADESETQDSSKLLSMYNYLHYNTLQQYSTVWHMLHYRKLFQTVIRTPETRISRFISRILLI